MSRRCFSFLVCVAWMGMSAGLMAAPALAQEPGVLNLRVKTGQTVWVMTDEGWEVKGVVSRMGPDSIEISGEGGTKRIAHADIRRVAKKDSLRNGFLIGAGLGVLAGIGYAVDAAPESVDSGERALGTLYFMALGVGVYGGIGALIDKAADGRETVYERPGRSAQLYAAPIVSRNRIGLGAAIRW